MTTGASYGSLNAPSGFLHQGRFGPSESALNQFLYPFAWRNVSFIFDDFHQAATLTDWWTLAADACATTFATNAGAGGRIQGSATDNNQLVSITGSVDWFGDNNAGMEVKWQVDALTGYVFETGFSDAKTDDTLLGVTDIDCPTVGTGVTDTAVFILCTDQTLKTTAFVTDGGTACMASTATTMSAVYEPTAAVYNSMRVQTVGNASLGFIHDANNAVVRTVSHGCTIASQIEGGTGMTPFFLGGTRDCNTETFTIDYIAVWQCR